MGRLSSYPKIYNLGHAAIREIFNEPVLIEEKVDGSQFSFGVIDGRLWCKSKGKDIDMENPEKLFAKAVEEIKRIKNLQPGWIYRGEVLDKPKHNVLAYDRVPSRHVILFDVSIGLETWLSRKQKEREANRLGMEIVPMIYNGMVENMETLNYLLDRVSVLGGTKIEGIVIKNYQRFCVDGKTMMSKLVSTKFREQRGKEWRVVKTNIKESIALKYCTKARWEKAIIHLKERGELLDSPQDIGNLLKEVNQDIIAECLDDIKHDLWQWAKKGVLKGATKGLPEWYKSELIKKQFNDKE